MPKPVILAETAIVVLILVTLVAGQLLAGPERPQPGGRAGILPASPTTP